MTGAWVVALLLAQAPTSSAFDDGAVVGRVCEDTDGDGRCGAAEPGVPGVTVMLETGLWARTDSAGRYHLAGVGARAADGYNGGRLQPGRHRVGVDLRPMPEGSRASPPAATVELPFGAVATQDFALTLPGRQGPALTPAADPPRAVLEQGELSVVMPYAAPGRAELRLSGAALPCEAGVCRATMKRKATSAGFAAPLVIAADDGRVGLWLQRVDVVQRQGSLLLVPREPQSLARVLLPSVPGAAARVDLGQGVSLKLDGKLVERSASGAVLAAVAERRVKLEWRLDDGSGWTDELPLPTPRGVFALALLDAEVGLDPAHGVGVFGRAAGQVRASLGSVNVSGEIDLRDTDVEAARATPGALLRPRQLDVFERQLDVTRASPTWGDDSATVADNPSDGRLRVEVSHEALGKVGLGSTRFQFADGELGRAHRALQGAYADVGSAKEATFGGRLRGVVGTGQVDPLTGLGREQAHDRFVATGGSLFYLRRAPVVTGSEWLRVELREALTGIPLGEQHLLRNRDYTVDYVSGRVLLAKPLSFFAARSVLEADPLSAGVSPELVVDYEAVASGASEGAVAGGELSGWAGPVKARAGALVDGEMVLLRAQADATLGPATLSAEVGSSRGGAGSLGFSTNGGMSFQTGTTRRPYFPTISGPVAVAVRLHSAGFGGKGAWDASWRTRPPDWVDASSYGQLFQMDLRGRQPLGPFTLAVVGNATNRHDPVSPFAGTDSSFLLGAALEWDHDPFGLRLEVRDAWVPPEDTRPDGRLSAALLGRWRPTGWLRLSASHRQMLLTHHGSPWAAFNDTFSTVGADVLLPGGEVGLRAGWGPTYGPQVWGVGQVKSGDQTWYGLQSFDADAPSIGERRTTVGVRELLEEGRAVFVEDAIAHDVNGLRLSRAVGVSQVLAKGLTADVRYERGVRALIDTPPEDDRDAGGASLSWELGRARMFARGEVRRETARADPGTALVQWVGLAGGEVTLTDDLAASARFQWSHGSRAGRMTTRLVEGVASVAWRPAWGSVIARYTYQQELLPAFRGGFPERRLQLVSLLPTVKLGDRFALSAGAHAGWTPDGLVLSGSLRPAVRVWSGLEVAAEVAQRSSAPGGGELTALRGELGWRFDHRFLLAGGYTFFGFPGTGIDDGSPARRDRVYLRAEVGW